MVQIPISCLEGDKPIKDKKKNLLGNQKPPEQEELLFSGDDSFIDEPWIDEVDTIQVEPAKREEMVLTNKDEEKRSMALQVDQKTGLINGGDPFDEDFDVKELTPKVAAALMVPQIESIGANWEKADRKVVKALQDKRRTSKSLSKTTRDALTKASKMTDEDKEELKKFIIDNFVENDTMYACEFNAEQIMEKLAVDILAVRNAVLEIQYSDNYGDKPVIVPGLMEKKKKGTTGTGVQPYVTLHTEKKEGAKRIGPAMVIPLALLQKKENFEQLEDGSKWDLDIVVSKKNTVTIILTPMPEGADGNV